MSTSSVKRDLAGRVLEVAVLEREGEFPPVQAARSCPAEGEPEPQVVPVRLDLGLFGRSASRSRPSSVIAEAVDQERGLLLRVDGARIRRLFENLSPGSSSLFPSSTIVHSFSSSVYRTTTSVGSSRTSMVRSNAHVRQRVGGRGGRRPSSDEQE